MTKLFFLFQRGIFGFNLDFLRDAPRSMEKYAVNISDVYESATYLAVAFFKTSFETNTDSFSGSTIEVAFVEAFMRPIIEVPPKCEFAHILE